MKRERERERERERDRQIVNVGREKGGKRKRERQCERGREGERRSRRTNAVDLNRSI